MSDAALLAPRASRRARLLVAACVAVLTAAFAVWQHADVIADGRAPDSLFLWRAARIVLAGGDPYPLAALNTMPAGEPDAFAWAPRLRDPLFYPLPAVLFWVPFSLGSFLVGSALFQGLGAFAFTYAVTHRGLAHAWFALSPGFLYAARIGQWSPWIAAALTFPLLGFLTPMKPNVGLGVVLARPTRAMLVGPTLALAIATLVQPSWIAGWLANVTGTFGDTAPHPAPVTVVGGAGVVLLLALLRWRRPEARLLATMALLPQLPVWADQLPLAHVARRGIEVALLVLCAWIGALAWLGYAPEATAWIDVVQPYALVSAYVPALLMILARPNEGEAPDWLVALRARIARRRVPSPD